MLSSVLCVDQEPPDPHSTMAGTEMPPAPLMSTLQASDATSTFTRCQALLTMPLMFQMGATVSG